MNVPRVALFTDCFHEVNGVALTCRQFESFAHRHELPFFSFRAGAEDHFQTSGSVSVLEWRRSRISLRLDSDMYFDLRFRRILGEARARLAAFRPDIVHITGPGDCGILGAILAHESGVPLAASWHTNIHEFGGRRLQKILPFVPREPRRRLATMVERAALGLTLRFYKIAKLLFAPNPELIRMLETATGKPVYPMRRGIDTDLFTPEKREPGEHPLTLGYVGRMSAEKNVRFLAELEQSLEAAGIGRWRFRVVGQGSELSWLQGHLKHAEFPGVLKGEALARAYAGMDVFIFPSETDTFGNVILESLASGVPPVVTASGGPKFLVREGETGRVVDGKPAFTEAVLRLLQDRDSRLRMRRKARQSALGQSWDAVFSEVYAAYQNELGKCGQDGVQPECDSPEAASESDTPAMAIAARTPAVPGIRAHRSAEAPSPGAL